VTVAEEQANAHDTGPEFGERILKEAFCGVRRRLAGCRLRVKPRKNLVGEDGLDFVALLLNDCAERLELCVFVRGARCFRLELTVGEARLFDDASLLLEVG
jgi:hypothetical protein